MNILLIPDVGLYGGCRTYFFNIVSFLANNTDFTVSVLLNGDSVDDEITNFLNDKKIDYEFSRIQDYDLYNKLKVNFIGAIYANIKEILSIAGYYFRLRPDLVIVSTGNSPYLISGALFPFNFLYIVHSVPSSNIGNIYGCILKGRFLKKGKIISTVSQFNKERIVKYWFNGDSHLSDSIKIIPTGVKSVKFKLKKKRTIILTLGAVEEYKNPMRWLDVAEKITKKFKNVEFVWGGDGSLFDYCSDRSKNNKQISFVGRIDNVNMYFSNTLLYFQPSLSESQGISVIEAMMRGIPCVVSKESGLAESVIDGRNGLLTDPYDKEDMCQKIETLLCDNKLIGIMGNESGKVYKEKFTEENWTKKMTEMFRYLK